MTVLFSVAAGCGGKTSLNKSRGGTIPIPKNCDSDSLAHFGGIGTGIVNKGIIKRIEKELFSDSQFLITQTDRMNCDSRFLILRNRATSR